LIKRALCEDPSDYESLLASLSVVKNLLDCDEDGLIVDSTATDILRKLFKDDGTGNGVWTTFDLNPTDPDTTDDPEAPNTNYGAVVESCFRDLNLYYNEKDCGISPCEWKVICNPCIEEAQNLTGLFPTESLCEDLSFSEMANAFARYLGCLPGGEDDQKYLANLGGNQKPFDGKNEPLEDVLKVLDALCDIVKQKATFKRILHKASLTITDCDF
jgi:hypothetical protein